MLGGVSKSPGGIINPRVIKQYTVMTNSQMISLKQLVTSSGQCDDKELTNRNYSSATWHCGSTNFKEFIKRKPKSKLTVWVEFFFDLASEFCGVCRGLVN